VATYPPHPLYKQLPIIPGDHAFNIMTEAIGLVIEWPKEQLKKLADGELDGDDVSIKARDLKMLLDQISQELGVDVVEYLLRPGRDAERCKTKTPMPEKLPVRSNLGLDPNFWE